MVSKYLINTSLLVRANWSVELMLNMEQNCNHYGNEGINHVGILLIIWLPTILTLELICPGRNRLACPLKLYYVFNKFGLPLVGLMLQTANKAQMTNTSLVMHCLLLLYCCLIKLKTIDHIYMRVTSWDGIYNKHIKLAGRHSRWYSLNIYTVKMWLPKKILNCNMSTYIYTWNLKNINQCCVFTFDHAVIIPCSSVIINVLNYGYFNHHSRDQQILQKFVYDGISYDPSHKIVQYTIPDYI